MIEVLKQMTEALEDITRLLQGITGGTFSKLDAAIQAGRQAIREHAMYEVQRLGQEIEQEPVAHQKWCASLTQLLLSMPPQPAPCNCHQPQLEQNFCARCGKRTNDIHTCTPPQRTEQEPQIAINAQVVGYVEPQRTWVGLTKDEVDSWNLPDHPTVFEFAQFIEAKLKEKNT